MGLLGMMGMPNQGMYNMGFPGNRPQMFGGRYWDGKMSTMGTAILNL